MGIMALAHLTEVGIGQPNGIGQPHRGVGGISTLKPAKQFEVVVMTVGCWQMPVTCVCVFTCDLCFQPLRSSTVVPMALRWICGPWVSSHTYCE